jgi:uncharacterized membrane-anchored protein
MPKKISKNVRAAAIQKLPEITLLFWIMKIAATTLGETAGDLFSMTLNIGYAMSSVLLIGVFLATLVTQLRAKTFHPALYWLVILSTSTAGTTMSDFMDRTLGLGYVTGSLVLISLLCSVLAYWYYSEGSLSIANIHTPKLELLYWGAILCSNTLGTAFGDFLADSSGLGFMGGALLVSSAIVAIIVAHYYTKFSTIILFWLAFILTRPLGATVGDLLTKVPAKGGLGFGAIGSSVVLLAVLIVLVVYSMRTVKKRQLILD